jgi:hypothetical protein
MMVWCGMDAVTRTRLSDFLDGSVITPGDPEYD